MAHLLKRMLALAALMVLIGAASLHAEDAWNNVDRIVAIGDIHGDYEQLLNMLRLAKVVDMDGKWVGGKTHLVQVGDLIDRGPQSRKAMDFMMQLEPQARKAGGYVHVLIGNHDAMNVYGDLRYVSKEDYASYATEQGVKEEPGKPAGFAGQRKLFAANGTYGKWVRSRNAIIKINDTVFLHGGIGPKYAMMSIREIND